MFEQLFQKYPFFRIVPSVLVMAIIFKLSSLTFNELQGFPHVWDKLAHCTEYATLAGTICMWWGRLCWRKKVLLRILVVVAFTLIYGCTDEFHQRFVEGRSCDILDLIADTLGGLIGASVYAFIVAILSKYDPLPTKNHPEE